jgi:hypothetical protein
LPFAFCQVQPRNITCDAQSQRRNINLTFSTLRFLLYLPLGRQEHCLVS